MYRWVCDVCEREKPDFQIKPPYSSFSSLIGSYCPFCHRNTPDRPVDENGNRVLSNVEKPSGKRPIYYIGKEEYEKMITDWDQVCERNVKIRKRDGEHIMDYVSNVKNIRHRKR